MIWMRQWCFRQYGRKKRNNSRNSVRSIAKKSRHSGDGKIASISCAHNVRNVCMATSLCYVDLSVFATKLNKKKHVFNVFE